MFADLCQEPPAWSGLILSLRKSFLSVIISHVFRQKNVTREEFLADRDSQDIVCFNLVQAIQGCADLASHIVSDEGWGIPNSYHDEIDILSEHHVFTLPQSETYKKMFGFRNHIVPRYAKIDPVEVYRAMTERLNDLEEIIAGVVAYFHL